MSVTISREMWKAYVTELSQINETAARKMEWWIHQHSNATREQTIAYAKALTNHYGTAASELAGEMYDAVAEAESAGVDPAELADLPTDDEVAKAINGTYGTNQMSDAVARLVKLAGQDTILNNAIRDGAYYAWVPNGDSCPFCITLASRGFEPASKKILKGGHAEHIHAHCDCSFCISFKGKTSVNIEGYDPDKYLEMYENADDSSYAWGSANNQREGKNHWQNESTARINGMRRAEYAKNKDAINAQKREAYARRKEFEENWNTGKYFKRDNPGT